MQTHTSTFFIFCYYIIFFLFIRGKEGKKINRFFLRKEESRNREVPVDSRKETTRQEKTRDKEKKKGKKGKKKRGEAPVVSRKETTGQEDEGKEKE